MAREYADDAYGVKQMLVLPTTGALNGTRAAVTALNPKVTFMHPVTVTDFNCYMTAGGTQANVSVIVNKALGGTGTPAAFGTCALGTSATADVVDGSATATDFVTGDDLTLSVSLGTATTVPDAQVFIQYRENFVDTDT